MTPEPQSLQEMHARAMAAKVRLGSITAPPVVRIPVPADDLQSQLAAMKAQLVEAERMRAEAEEARTQAELDRAEMASRFCEWENLGPVEKVLHNRPFSFTMIDGTVIEVPWAARPKTASSVRHVGEYVARQFGFRMTDIISHRRPQAQAHARRSVHTAVLILFPTLSLPHLARLFDRDHTTIIYSMYRTLGRDYRYVARAIAERWRAEAEAIVGGSHAK